MSSKIQILDSRLVNQIAAGEVVERPSSVVKELVENSIDAGSTQIEVFLSDAGKKEIRVRDNGCGMSAADIRLSVERHATSKIRCLDDLFKVKTLGFRGEALPSIASVSRLTITTQEANSTCGICLKIEGGKLLKEEPMGAPQGTEVRVLDLFFNTPARLKFLKSNATELSHAVSTVEHLALSHPEISFRFTHENKELLFAPKTDHAWERVTSILGNPKSMYIYVEENVLPFSLKAYVSLPRFIVPTSKSCYIFVNGRPVVDRTILHALTSAYQNLIPHGQYPKAVLFLEVEGDELDVNVHPTKREVRFKDSRSIHRFIEQAIQKMLSQETDLIGVPSVSISDVREGVEESILSYSSRREQNSHFSFYPPDYRTHGASARSQELHEPSQSEMATGTSVCQSPFQTYKWNYIGQIRNSYILCESKDELLFIDQHAAHERLFFEKLLQKLKDSQLEMQYLLVPLSLELLSSEALSLVDLLPAFHGLGFEIEPFGGATFLVKSVPRLLQDKVTVEFLKSLIDELKFVPKTLLGEALLYKVLATLACHSARTAHEKLQRDEVLALLSSLDDMDQAPHCPHGRPFSFRLPISEIEKKFRR